MKPYQRVNLKSPRFKDNKSKSPLSPNNRSIPQNPNQLFQRVCCPNCRYLFKVINNQNVISKTKKQDKVTKTDNTTQTYNQYFQLETSRKKSSIMVTSPKRSIYDFDNSQRSFIPNINESMRSSKLLFQPVPSKSRTKSGLKIVSGTSKNMSRQEKTTPKNSQNKYSKNSLKQSKDKIQSIQKLNLLKTQIITKLTMQQQIKHLKQLVKNLPRQISIPSYCKTLLDDDPQKYILKIS